MLTKAQLPKSVNLKVKAKIQKSINLKVKFRLIAPSKVLFARSRQT